MIDDGYKTFELCSDFEGIEVALDESDVRFDDGSFVLDPIFLRFYVFLHVSGLEMVQIFCDHFVLWFIGSILLSF